MVTRDAHRRRILLIEDDVDLREAITDVLDDYGHSVESAADGAEGLRRLREFHPDIIVLDLMMPNLDGWQFRLEQRRDPANATTPVVVISANHDATAAAIDADLYLRKPVDAETLVNAVEGVLNAREHRLDNANLAQTERLAAMGTLAAGLAHEINNPLTYVLLQLSRASRMVATLAPQPGLDGIETALQSAREGADRIRGITSAIRLFTDPGAESISIGPIDVRAPITAAIEVAMHAIRERAHLTTVLPEAAFVIANEGQLAQVFVDLLTNAAQAIPEGRSRSSRDPGCRHPGRRPRRDRGARIPATEFHLGYSAACSSRSSRPSRSVRAPGSACRSVTTSSRHSQARSRSPAPSATDRHSASSSPQRTKVRERVMAGDVPILVVDDREENLVAVESVLAGAGYELVTATSGSVALKHVLDRDFGAILVDVMMPRMDGFELVTIIKQRERSRHTPIIFLTAGAPDLEHIYRGYSVGAVDYMTKPLDPDVLRAKVAIFADLFRKDRRIVAQSEALRVASEQRYRNLAEAIPQIVWTASPDGAMTYFNRRWSEQTGQDLDAATGWGWLATIHPEDAERCTQTWRDGVATGSLFQLECRLRARDGYRWHLGRAVPELGPSGIVAWLGTFTDFDELHRAYDAAERAIHTRDEFLSIASHELRTPLTTLQLRLHSLKRDLLREVTGSETERKLDATLRQGHRLMSLVDSLLDVSRITTGRIRLNRETFDVIAAIRELVQRFTEVAAMASVTLELRAEGVLEGSWDRLRVEQIVENLVTNALKYAPKAPVEITVHRPPRRREARRPRSGARHRRDRSRADLRGIRTSGLAAQLRRSRARPVHRAPERRSPRGHDHRRVETGRWDDVCRRASVRVANCPVITHT